MIAKPTETSYRPRLRAHLRVEQDRLDDTLLDRSLVLEGAAAALVPLLDGATEWSLVRSTLIERGHAAEAVDNALRRLLLIHAVEGAGDAMASKLERVLRGEETVPTSILEGARFECQGSGSCCQGYALGPLSDADVAALDALPLATAFPHVVPPFVETTEGGRFLRRDGARCVFLTDERRCGLHAAFGSDAKPGFCRLFPLESFATIEGIRVVDRGTCATFSVSARVGLPLVDDLARVRPLLQPPVLHHPVVLVEQWAWDYAIFLRFTTAATTLIKRKLGSASETLMAIGRCLDALTDATAQCPIEPGQPDAAVSDVLAIDGAAWYRTPHDDVAVAGLRAWGELLRALRVALTDAIDLGQTHASAARELAVVIEHAVAAVTEAALPARSLPAADPDVDAALRLSMRQQLFGRRVLVGGRPSAGLVRIAVIQLLALAGARLGAGDRALVARDLDGGHALATRAFESGGLDAVVVDHEPRWRVLLDGLAHAAHVFTG
jgi:Fe-S-cluster containining protein